ncbi:hypothetical protein OEA41_000190 [Lepraria neglecta]|uniref:Uncharacterized protein n=1 Tax=Lepraria neglecta TaxID=209136 RepID=A0AAD9ZI31_9LECA|nr:hypothetical protein OEA41_000190 [Lepraria neglecta]
MHTRGWYHVVSVEALLQQAGQEFYEARSITTQIFLAIFTLADYLFADERTIPNLPSKFTLRPLKRHALDLWKARHMHDMWELGDLSINHNSLHRGRDSKTFYLNVTTRDYNGYYDDGTLAQLDSDEVSNCSLDDVMINMNQHNYAHVQAQVTGHFNSASVHHQTSRPDIQVEEHSIVIGGEEGPKTPEDDQSNVIRENSETQADDQSNVTSTGPGWYETLLRLSREAAGQAGTAAARTGYHGFESSNTPIVTQKIREDVISRGFNGIGENRLVKRRDSL